MEDYNSGINIIKELDKIEKPVYVVPGNWDFVNKKHFERFGKLNLKKYQDLIKKSKNINWWNRGIKKINNLRILAFGGKLTPGAHIKENLLYKEYHKKAIKENQKETKQIMKHKDKNIDILLAHYPPYGFFDKVKYKGYNPMNNKKVGFKGYNDYIEKYNPKLFICGHMHEYQGMKKLGNTIIITTGAAKEGKAVIIDWNENKGKVEKIEFIK